MSSAARLPAVAGHFYPREPEILLRDLRLYLQAPKEKVRAIGCLVPHAGYMYSGHVAGAVYASLNLPKRYIILCPNHTGMGEPLAIMSSGEWLTPLGAAQIDAELAEQLKAEMHWLSEDAVAHRAEHALEVQLPFLQMLVPEFSFVPIAIGVSRYEVLAALGEALASVIARRSEPALLVASSDMNHYESDDATRTKDQKAISQILALDSRGLHDTVFDESISMCGFGPTVAMLTAARRLGATSARLIKYATSGDINNDRSAVVGYAGIVVS
jgi:AmmeMemoRadiSam system protein B